MEVIKLQITKKSLGPCFGGTITLMRVVPSKDKDNRLILFSTKEKIMGLMSLPIDGNPYRYMGVIAHPGDIKNIKSTHTFNYLFTTGGSDYTINIWKYNPNPLIDVVQSGGEGIEPFLNLLEGRDGLNIKKWLIIPIIHKLNLKMKILLNKEFRSNSYSEFNSCYAC